MTVLIVFVKFLITAGRQPLDKTSCPSTQFGLPSVSLFICNLINQTAEAEADALASLCVLGATLPCLGSN